jgi:hypothetical protein
MQVLFSFDRGIKVEKTLMQTLASQLSCKFCSRLTGTSKLRKLSCKLSLLNSRASFVLVWPGHQSWENSHANSRFSTLVQVLFSFDRDIKVEKALMQTLASQLILFEESFIPGVLTYFTEIFSVQRHDSSTFKSRPERKTAYTGSRQT